VLRRFQDLGQALALIIDVLRERGQDVRILDGVLGGPDVVGADSLDNLIVAAVVGFLGSSSSAEEAVGGSFGLCVVAAGGADDGGAVVLETSSTRR
jgi:hypothetical protein